MQHVALGLVFMAVSSWAVRSKTYTEKGTVRDCDKAMKDFLDEGFKEPLADGILYIQGLAGLSDIIGCYKRAPKYTDATGGPADQSEFNTLMSKMVANRTWTEDLEIQKVSAWNEIQKVSDWNTETEYVSFQDWKKAQEDMWNDFLRIFKDTRNENIENHESGFRVVLATDVGRASGGSTTSCLDSEFEDYQFLCKSGLWSLVHFWDYLELASHIGHPFTSVDLVFYKSNAWTSNFPVPGGDRAVLLHLQDASYSGLQASQVTEKLQGENVINVGMIVVGQRTKRIRSTACAWGQRCFIFGKEGGKNLKPKACPDIVNFATTFEIAHFLVQHKVADGYSLGTCGAWYSFLGIFAPYSQPHQQIPLRDEQSLDPPN